MLWRDGLLDGAEGGSRRRVCERRCHRSNAVLFQDALHAADGIALHRTADGGYPAAGRHRLGSDICPSAASLHLRLDLREGIVVSQNRKTCCGDVEIGGDLRLMVRKASGALSKCSLLYPRPRAGRTAALCRFGAVVSAAVTVDALL